MEFWEALALAVLTGTVSAAATVAAIKTDVLWIKSTLREHGKRISRLEGIL